MKKQATPSEKETISEEQQKPSTKAKQSWLARIVPAKKLMHVAVILVTLQVLDGVLTTMGVSKWGVRAEGNPFIRRLMIEWGYIPTLALVKTMAVLIVLMLASIAQRVAWIRGAMGIMSCFYLFAVVIPWAYFLFWVPFLNS